jgi:hypothetical protein
MNTNNNKIDANFLDELEKHYDNTIVNLTHFMSNKGNDKEFIWNIGFNGKVQRAYNRHINECFNEMTICIRYNFIYADNVEAVKKGINSYIKPFLTQKESIKNYVACNHQRSEISGVKTESMFQSKDFNGGSLFQIKNKELMAALDLLITRNS